MFKIGNVEIKSQVVLAPMAGVSNHSFRKLAKEMGAGFVVSEMVSDHALHYKNKKTFELLYMEEEERPVAQQIFGSNLEYMLEAAVFLDKHSNCDIIDINMGCPVPKVALKNQAGAALMKNPEAIYQIVKTIKDNVSKPVSVKIRSGWDFNSINAVEIAKIVEKAGADAITIHARTRSQGYSGMADWQIIKAVKEAVAIPVIGNGDVVDGKSAKKMLEETKVDAVMVGRAAMGNPWIFREIIHYLKTGEELVKPTYQEIEDVILRHLNDLLTSKNKKVAILEMRGHGSSYIKGLPNNANARKQIMKVNTKEEFIKVINDYFKSLESSDI